MMNLSSLSKATFLNLVLLATIASQASLLYFEHPALAETQHYFIGAEAFLVCLSLFYGAKARYFVRDIIRVCQAIRIGDFEERIINRKERGNLEQLSNSVNNAIDICDAFVRESALAMRAASEGKYYRKIRPEGMQGAFLNSLNGINAAIDLLAEKDLADGKNRKMVELTIAEIGRLADSISDGELSMRIDAMPFDGRYRELIERMNTLVETVETPVILSQNTLTSLSEGDLTQDMGGSFHGAFANMQVALNRTIAKLNGMVEQIRQSADEVSNSSQEVSVGSSDLSQRTEEQASTLQQTAASMEEISGAVDQNAKNAQNAVELAQKSSSIASSGVSTVHAAVSAMEEIQEASKKVVDIISAIDEIAFQTNLLALNAAVEAARAGEAGKGFAVVASEVRTLAGRSAEASKAIKKLIMDSNEVINKGSQLVTNSGQTFNEIAESVKEVTALVSQIADASKEQSIGIREINQAVSQMDEVTQQNAALVEQSTAAATSMVDQAKQLTALIAFFRVAEHGEALSSSEDEDGLLEAMSA